MRNLMLVAALCLSGCGADTQPEQPAVTLGVGVGASGVNTYGGVGLSQGPVSVFFGF